MSAERSPRDVLRHKLNETYARMKWGRVDTRFMAPEVLRDYMSSTKVESDQVLALFEVLMDRIEDLELDIRETRSGVRWLEISLEER